MVFSKVFDHGVRVGREGQIRAICRGAFAPKKNEFKSNLERSFESLQKQFQMKADELERVKKYLEKDEKRILSSCNKL